MASRRISIGQIAKLKSQLNALRLVQRLLWRNELNYQVAARELDNIQTAMYYILKTPKKSVL